MERENHKVSGEPGITSRRRYSQECSSSYVTPERREADMGGGTSFRQRMTTCDPYNDELERCIPDADDGVWMAPTLNFKD